MLSFASGFKVITGLKEASTGASPPSELIKPKP